MNKPWGPNIDQPTIINVYPLYDEEEHELDYPETCWCKPVIRDGMYVHNSADCREIVEQAEDILRQVS